MKYLWILPVIPAVSFLFILFNGCASLCNDEIVSVSLAQHSNNALRKTLKIVTRDKVDLLVRYWQKGNQNHIDSTLVSQNKTVHYSVLNYLKPSAQYEYEIVVRSGNCESVSEKHTFTSNDLPIGLEDLYLMDKSDTIFLPEKFRSGYILMSRRDLPGIASIVDTKGKIVWYYQANETGFKVAHFTKNSTVLSILAPPSYPTSYGNEILELSLTGDTLFHLKKGEKGFDKTIHHEILWNDSKQLVTLTLEKRIFDLSKVGGNKKDTITGDGILVLDHNGNKVWSWSVFDEMNPLKDPNILRDKSDWLHANSLCIDKDGNYFVSFYLSGQIWKINSKTGKIIWKMGRSADFKFPDGDEFFESHDVHFTPQNEMILFENGTNKQQSRVWIYALDETNREANLKLKIALPPYLYSARMGSAYQIDSTILVCSSQARSVVLTNEKGDIIWHLRLGFIPYRAEFIDSAAFFHQLR